MVLHEKFIVDAQGRKTAAVLPYPEWKKVAAILEEYEDIRAYDKAKALPSHPLPFKDAIKKLKADDRV
jgi:hypothetical protein